MYRVVGAIQTPCSKVCEQELFEELRIEETMGTRLDNLDKLVTSNKGDTSVTVVPSKFNITFLISWSFTLPSFTVESREVAFLMLG